MNKKEQLFIFFSKLKKLIWISHHTYYEASSIIKQLTTLSSRSLKYRSSNSWRERELTSCLSLASGIVSISENEKKTFIPFVFLTICNLFKIFKYNDGIIQKNKKTLCNYIFHCQLLFFWVIFKIKKLLVTKKDYY